MTKELFDLSHTKAEEYLSAFTYAWEALTGLQEYIISIGQSLPADEFTEISEHVWVHKSASISPTAYLGSPCIIGAGTKVRHCALIRESALIGENCVVGNSVELKNVILFDEVQVPHFNYVGDSILGYQSHIGAGAVTSNVKSDKSKVVIKDGELQIQTNLEKLGALLGDFVEVGCNSVLNPGTVVGKNATVYPLSSVRGVVKENCIYKSKDDIVIKR